MIEPIGEPLFNMKFLSDLLSLRDRKVAKEIEEQAPDWILGGIHEEFIAHLLQTYAFQIPHLHEEEITADTSESPIDISHDHQRAVSDRSRPFVVTGAEICLSVPFDGEPEAFKWSPSRSQRGVKGIVKDRTLIIGFRVYDPREELKPWSDRALAAIRDNLECLRKDVETFNSTIAESARSRIASRKQRLLRDRGIAGSLGYPLRRRTNSTPTYAVPIQRMQLAFSPPRLNAPFQPEPLLETSHYDEILSVFAGMTTLMERSPNAFRTLEEEDLRWHFLFQLNWLYEGCATGETFNFAGKTDILVRVGDKNVFIAECKFWKGPVSFTRAIDQLMGYAAWRDTKLALLVFNRQKQFSRVLAQIPGLLQSHPNYHRPLESRSESGFRCQVRHRLDDDRLATLTVLAFDVPSVDGSSVVKDVDQTGVGEDDSE